MDMRDKNNYDKFLVALSEIYIALYFYNLKENKLEPIKTNQFIEKWAAEKEGAQEKTNNVMKNITVPEHQNMILDFVDFSTLDERMGTNNNVSIVFQGKINGWCRARFVEVDRDENGKLHHVIYCVECINEEKKRENHLLYLSQTDLMTGIYNRGHGEAAIKERIREEKCGAFGLFDVDHFKQFNDIYGHKTGDEVLIGIADCMKRVFSAPEIAMRLGGDEFAFFIPGATKKEDIEEKIKQLFGEISKIHLKPMNQNIVVSLGVAFCREDDDFDSIYKRADAGVYHSKRNKDCSMTYCE